MAIRVGTIALAFLAVHALAVLAPWAGRMPASYVMQLLAPLSAAGVAYWVSRDVRNASSTRWMLVSIAFLFWTVGMASSLCIDLRVAACAAVPATQLGMSAYVLYGVPLLLVLATPSSEWASPVIRGIDAVMVAMLTGLVLVNAFGLTHETEMPDLALAGGYLVLFDVENGLLMIFAAVRLAGATSWQSRALYRSLAAYTAMYFVTALFYNRFVFMTLGLEAGSTYDLLVDLPFIAFCFTALAVDHEHAAPHRVAPRLQRFSSAIPPLFLTLTIVALAGLVARGMLLLAIACTVLAILGYGIRSTLQQMHHMGAASRAERDRDAMSELAWSDALTGIGNRRAFDAALHLQWDQAQRTGQELALLMIDIDHFKAINDTLGHTAGDQVILAISQALVGSAKWGSDLLVRFGGDEFACLLPGTSLQDAHAVGECMRHGVEALAIRHPGSASAVATISVGVASLRVDRTMSSSLLVDAADRALYRAKANGRNGVAS